ncbi:MAG: hypothetical protein KIPDCIKN_01814 [Haliscomenobacter sp.]|jgi:hypothetical protein|nr:hypothetical protein [Haliscomenobacter sp.]
MIKYLYCAFTGRLARWNALSEKLFLKTQKFISQYPENERNPFMAFVTASEFALRYMLHPMKGKERLIKKDIKSISEEEFMNLHTCMLNHLMAIHFSVNGNSDVSNIGKNFSKYTGQDFIESNPVKIVSKNPPIDLAGLSSNIWSEMSNILAKKDDGFLKWVLVSPILSEYYQFSLDFIKRNTSYIVIQS